MAVLVVFICFCLVSQHALASPYTPCGGSCTSDGFVAGGEPGVWVGQVCPAKCAECQSDGVLTPRLNASLPPPLHSNHWCQTSPDSMYMRPTYENSSVFSVSVGGDPVFTPTMRGYVGRVHFAQAVVSSSANTFLIHMLDTTAVPDPSKVRGMTIVNQ